jgi:metallo-beta-lactamase class B
MKRYSLSLIGTILVAGLITSNANAQAAQADAHVAAAKAAMSPKAPNARPWQAFESVFKQQCTPPRPGARPEAEPIGSNAPLEPAEQRKLTPTPHDQWYVPPTKVFDNLYYIGTRTESTWALTTSAGIILLNTNFEWVTADLLNELKTFGLDPANVKYALIGHAHSDQAWGINVLKKMVPTARVIAGEGDWDTLAKDNTPARMKPTKDIVAKDGQKLTLGDTTVTIYVTPMSSPGQLTVVMPLKDGNQQHVGIMIGGTTMNLIRSGVKLYPDQATMFKQYIGSLERIKNIQATNNVDTIVSIHAALDTAFSKMEALKSRKPGDPHPFVSKDDVDRFSTLLLECARAKQAWASGN